MAHNCTHHKLCRLVSKFAASIKNSKEELSERVYRQMAAVKATRVEFDGVVGLMEDISKRTKPCKRKELAKRMLNTIGGA